MGNEEGFGCRPWSKMIRHVAKGQYGELDDVVERRCERSEVWSRILEHDPRHNQIHRHLDLCFNQHDRPNISFAKMFTYCFQFFSFVVMKTFFLVRF